MKNKVSHCSKCAHGTWNSRECLKVQDIPSFTLPKLGSWWLQGQQNQWRIMSGCRWVSACVCKCLLWKLLLFITMFEIKYKCVLNQSIHIEFPSFPETSYWPDHGKERKLNRKRHSILVDLSGSARIYSIIFTLSITLISLSICPHFNLHSDLSLANNSRWSSAKSCMFLRTGPDDFLLLWSVTVDSTPSHND